MELIKQPNGSSLCGQCVVAMLTGATLDDVLDCMGDGRTYPKKMRSSLGYFGSPVERRGVGAEEGRGPIGRTGAALLTSTDGRTHWIAWSGHEWLDPRLGAYQDYREHYDATVSIYLAGGEENERVER